MTEEPKETHIHIESFIKKIIPDVYLWPDQRWKDIWLGTYEDSKNFQTEPDVSQTLFSLAIAKRCRVIVETGVANGVGATPWLAYAAKIMTRLYGTEAQYYGIELDPRCGEIATARLNEWGLPGTIIQCNALEAPVKDIDLLFIDDDHDHRHLRKEIEYFLPLMSMQGLITVHDIAHPAIMKVVADYGGHVLIEPIFAGGLGVIFPQ